MPLRVAPASKAYHLGLLSSRYGEEHAEEGPEGPLEANKPQSEIRQDPLKLPAGFEWSTVCVDQPAQVGLLLHLDITPPLPLS